MSRTRFLGTPLAPLAVAIGIALAPHTASAAIGASFSSGELLLTTDAGDLVQLDCQLIGGLNDPTGQVLVNGADLTGVIPGGVQCGQVARIVVLADALSNDINLGAANPAAFTQLTSTSLNGGAGDDGIVGSFVGDEIVGGPGFDQIFGNDGDDLLVWNPGDGTDSVDGQGGQDRQVVQGGNAADPFFVEPGDGSSFGDVHFSRNPGFDIFLTDVEELAVFGNGGNDSIDAGTLPAGLIALELFGGDDNDAITGSAGDDLIDAGAGNDNVDANPGADSIALGEGDDLNTWNPGDGTDSVRSGGGSDRQVVQGGDNADQFSVEPGDGVTTGDVRFFRTPGFEIFLFDTEQLSIFGNGGDDILSGSALAAGQIALELNGGDGNDIIQGSVDADFINAGAGNDTVTGDGGVDTILLGDDDDRSIWRPGHGTDSVTGGNGLDVQIVEGGGGADPFFVEPGDGSSTGEVRFFRNPGFEIFLTAMEQLDVLGNGGDDLIDAGAMPAGLMALDLFGGDGNDTIIGSAGNDVIDGGLGNDSVDANPGTDTIFLGDGDDLNVWNPGDGTDTVHSGAGTDRQVVQGGGNADPFFVEAGDGSSNGDVHFFRNPGFEIFLFATEQLAVFGNGGADTLDASTLPAGLIALELNGGDDNDLIAGSAGVDRIDAGAGNDNVDGNAGNDDITLGDGDDLNTWDPGDGTDRVVGGTGRDRQVVQGGGNADPFFVAPGDGSSTGDVRFFRNPGFEIFLLAMEDLAVFGNGGDDTLDASAMPAGLIALELSGGAGNDTIIGSAGSDRIDGGTENDIVDGNPGNDMINLGDGDDQNTWNNGDNSDQVIGGPGNDRQIVNGASAGDEAVISRMGGAGTIEGLVPFDVRFARTNLVPFTVDMATIEALEVNLRDGEDRLATEGLPTTQQFLDGGAPDQFPGDVLDVAGFSGPLDSNPVISLPGFADIAQVNFETDTAGLGATTTTISSALPDPTVVGQPYTVTVEVAGLSNAPVGTISVSDGTDSCGPVALIAAGALSSAASCDLSSSSAGAKTLTATFAPTVDGFTASSGNAGHLVNAAATSVSVTGPDRLRINTPTAFSANLAVAAPGGGEPAGTVTLNGGGSSCTISLPSVTPSCELSFGSVGAKTITAAFVPGNADYLGSSSNGSGDLQSVAFVLANLEVTKTDNVGTYFPGDLLVYTVQLRNEGPDDAVNLRLLDPVPAGLENVLWTCDSSGGVDCPENNGSGDLDLAISTYPVGALLNFSYYGNVQGSPASITNVASIVLPVDATVEDVNLANNSASDLNLAEVLFTDSFENPPAVPELVLGSSNIQAEFDSLRIPVEALTPLLDETARPVFQLRDASGAVANVYARLREGQVELALAVRQQDGIWQLSSWQAYTSEPLLSWTAQLSAAGWTLISVGWED